MAGETVITVVGNLTADPELRYTAKGDPVASFTIASTPRSFDRASGEWKDGDALFLRGSAWRDLAEHVAKSLSKGTRVIVQGRLRQRSYETREGEKRTSYEIEVDEIAPSLRYATAQVERASRNAQGNQPSQGGFTQPPAQQQAPQQPANDAWGTPQQNDSWNTPQQSVDNSANGWGDDTPF